MNYDDGMTLGAARDALREEVDLGATCPCCRQFAKVYKRSITGAMAAGLIELCHAAEDDQFVHVPTLLTGRSAWRGGDAAKLRYWGLAEEEEDLSRPDGGRTGWWRVTDAGRRWIQEEFTVPKYACVYDGRCLGLTGDPVSVRDCLGEQFDYRELMSR